MLQQLFNAADTAIVGLFDTSSSLAAVGTNGKIIALIVALSSGLSVGVNVLVAQQIRQLYRCRKILRICLVFSIVSSLILIEPLVIFRNFFVGFFSADQTVIQNACLRILCILFFEPLCNLYEIPAGVLRVPDIPCTRLLLLLLEPAVFALYGSVRFSDIIIS